MRFGWVLQASAFGMIPRNYPMSKGPFLETIYGPPKALDLQALDLQKVVPEAVRYSVSFFAACRVPRPAKSKPSTTPPLSSLSSL